MSKKRHNPSKKAENTAFSAPRPFESGFWIVYLARNKKPARSEHTIQGFALYDAKGNLKAHEMLPRGMELSPREWSDNRARAVVRDRVAKHYHRRIYRLQGRLYRLADQLAVAKPNKRALILSARKKLLREFYELSGLALEQSEVQSRVQRTEDKLSFKEEERVRFIRRTYRHALIELSRDPAQAKRLLQVYVQKIYQVVRALWKANPKQNARFDIGLLMKVPDRHNPNVIIERVFPGYRVYAEDEELLKEQVYQLKEKIYREFFELAPSRSFARRHLTKAYFLGIYQDALVEVSGFIVDVVAPPRVKRLSALEKHYLSIGHEAASRLRKRTEAQKARKKNRGKKQKKKPKARSTRRKRGRIPGYQHRLKTERNPRRGK